MEKCNQYKCLRKYRENAESEISDYCNMYSRNNENRILNSKECPFYCEKFWCYEMKKEITRHEDVHWISSDMKDLSYERYNYLFGGLSNQGSDIQEKREQFENKHENEDSTICPYCDYEFEDCCDVYEEMDDEEMECRGCGKTFLLTVEVEYKYSTSKMEEFDETEAD